MSSSGSTQNLVTATTFDAGYLAAFEEKMFYEGPKLPRRLTNFAVLLGLACVIATFGVVSDSTATVIGAMIVAPLMGPIMATAAAVIMGNSGRAWRSLGLVAIGVSSVIILSWLLGFIVPDISLDFVNNGEITSRISPGLVALLTALASGAAGAFIMSREEIADSMGGVAIAISLVPPLCVVGLSLNQGQWDAATGAFLLFSTNFLAILLAGGITFLIVGLGRVAATAEGKRTRQRALVAIIIATILIAIPLGITTWQAVSSNLEEEKAANTVDAWLIDTPNRRIAVDVRNQRVFVTAEGQGEFPAIGDLADMLAEALGHPVVVSVRQVPSETAASDE